MNTAKQVLIVYYSLTGNTARVARDLAARLDADIESIQDKGHGAGFVGQIVAAFDALRKKPARIEPVQRNPRDYALTIVGTPVWAGQMTPAVRAYLEGARGKLHDAAFFITSGDTSIDAVAPSLAAVARTPAIAAAGFNARVLADRTQYERALAAFVSRLPRTRAAA